MTPLLVSVVTPTYKQPQFLPLTIDSILQQTYPHIEYMIFDDGSPDETPQVLDQYRQLDFYIERHTNMGQTATINKGWRMAKGDILAWLNSDDSYFPDTVERAAAYFEANPDVMWVYGDPYPVDELGNYYPFRNPAANWDYQLLLQRNFITQPAVFLRREVVETCGYLDESLHYIMDYEYWLRIGQRFPGTYVPGITARVTRYRETKTVSGGFPRLAELERIVKSYGGTDLPRTSHYEWIIAALEDTFKEVGHFHLWGSLRSFGKLFRYPSAIPRGTAKFFLLKFVPPRVETWLRQRLLHG